MVFESVLAMRLALYQPDIPQNTGAMLRLAACMGIGVDIVEPCGFLLDDRRLRRAGMVCFGARRGVGGQTCNFAFL